VRGSATLLSLYYEMFESEFGYIPPPPCCGNMADWYKFTNSNNTKIFIPKNIKIMGFKVKDKNEIYSFYNAKHKENGLRRTERVYGSKMNEDWAVAYLTIGTPEEIEKRKKDFIDLPKLDKLEIDSNNETVEVKKSRKSK